MQRKNAESATDEPMTTAKALHLFRKELLAHGFPETVVDELVIDASKRVVDGEGLGVKADV